MRLPQSGPIRNPARSCAAVRELPKQLLCDIEAIAVLE